MTMVIGFVPSVRLWDPFQTAELHGLVNGGDPTILLANKMMLRVGEWRGAVLR